MLTSDEKYRISNLLNGDNYCYTFADIRELCSIPPNVRITEYIMSLPGVSVKNGKITRYSALREAKIKYYNSMPDSIKYSGQQIKNGLSDISDSIDELQYHIGSSPISYLWGMGW